MDPFETFLFLPILWLIFNPMADIKRSFVLGEMFQFSCVFYTATEMK